jgi:hypothetical protein
MLPFLSPRSPKAPTLYWACVMVYSQNSRCSQHWTGGGGGGGGGRAKVRAWIRGWEGETKFVLSMFSNYNFVILAGMVSRVLSKIVWNTLNLIVRDNAILIFFHSEIVWKMDIHIDNCFSSNIYLFAWKASNILNAYLNLSHPKIYAWNAILLVVTSKHPPPLGKVPFS